MSEQQLREQMCEAIRSAEAAAHRTAEDAYQEASYAGEAAGLTGISKPQQLLVVGACRQAVTLQCFLIRLTPVS